MLETSDNTINSHLEFSEPEIKYDRLLKHVTELKQQGVDQFNPTGFKFIESLIKRSSTQRESVRQNLELKADKALDHYLLALAQARSTTESLIKRLEVLINGQVDGHLSREDEKRYALANDYFQRGRYVEAQSMIQPLLADYSSKDYLTTPSKSALALLLDELSDSSDSTKNHAKIDIHRAFFEELTKQDHGISQRSSHPAIEQSQFESSQSQKNYSVSKKPNSLKSSLALKKRKQQQRVEDFIDIALSEKPETPGPLNPENLAIELLKRVKDISPSFLNYYVSYFEALQCLEKKPSI